MKNRFLQLIEDQQAEMVRTQQVEVFVEQLKKQKKKAPTEEQQAGLIPKIEIGDSVDVHQRILEGEKERTQVFSGVVIAMRGEGLQALFTVRRIVQGEGVERIFPLYSPKIARIEVTKQARVRRAKLYYLRDRVGKATRLKERLAKGAAAEAAAKKKTRRRASRKKAAESEE